jgi:uncharacterized protein (DUF1501 family)
MTDVPRRRFLAGLGLGAGAVVAGGYGLGGWMRDDGSRGARPAPDGRIGAGELGGRDDRTLVVLELGGGNDSLSSVVPIGAGAGTYHDLRPNLAVADPLPLDDDLGLHPRLAALAHRYRKGEVAVVEGIGYARYDLSHFGSLATWWSAAGGAGQAGWLGRYLDGTVGFDDPLAGVSIGAAPSPALAGQESFATSLADRSGLTPHVPDWVGAGDDLLDAWRRLAPADVDPSTLLGRVQGSIAASVGAAGRLDRTLSDPAAEPAPIDGGPEGAPRGRAYAGGVSSALGLAALLVAAPRPPRVIYVNGVGDYDTHEGQAARHPALMADLDAGIDAFFRALEAKGAAARTLVVTVSDFGRRPHENGDGTDHGTTATHFLVGPGVKGGRYGAPADLRQLDATGNLVPEVDFRRLYATVLDGWLGVDAQPVLGGEFAPLPVLA